MRALHRTTAPLSHGSIPTIACINRATGRLEVRFTELIHTLQSYVDHHVAPVWGTPARLVKTAGFVKGAWALVFLDDPDAAGALAHHDLTPDGCPQAKVFVRTARENGDPVSVVASHQLAEMLVDPAINLTALGPDPRAVYAYECADPVEALGFGLNGMPVSDFVYPAYFEPFHESGSVAFDHLHAVRSPFQILTGGHQNVFLEGRWTQRFGSAERAQAFVREDRRGDRSERRATVALKRADVDAIAPAA
jgi:hypothetical protein